MNKIKYIVLAIASLYCANYYAMDLIEAVKSNNIYKARYLITKGTDINFQDIDGLSAINWAIITHNTQMFQMLIDAGSNINICDKSGKSPLCISAYLDKSPFYRFLINNGADVNHKSNDGNSILHASVNQNNIKAVKYLVKKGANIDITNNQNKTPLSLAIQQNKLDIAAYLLSKDASIDFDDEYISQNNDRLAICFDKIDENKIKDKRKKKKHKKNYLNEFTLNAKQEVLSQADLNTLLLFAVKSNNLRAVEELLNKGANVKALSAFHNILHLAIKNLCCLEIMRLLVAAGADINKVDSLGQTPLHIATLATNVDVVRFLLQLGADANKADLGEYTPLDLAFTMDKKNKNYDNFNNKHIKGLLIDCGAFFSDYSKIFTIAADDFHDNYTVTDPDIGIFKMIRSIIRKQIDLNEKKSGRAGHTLLTLATKHNKPKIVKFLIINGADVNATNARDKTPLFYAIKKNNFRITKILAKNGANLNKVDNSDNAPVFSTLEENKFVIFEYLISAGAKINQKNKFGEPLLLCAVGKNNPHIVSYLTDCDIIVDLTNDQYQTSLDTAIELGLVIETPKEKANSEDIINLLVAKTFKIQKEILDAIFNTDINKIDYAISLIKKHIRTALSYRNSQGETMLHLAVANSSVDMIKNILPLIYKKLLEVKNNSGQNPVMLAAQNRSEFLNLFMNAAFSTQEANDQEQIIENKS